MIEAKPATCPTGKRSYPTHEDAARTLRKAKRRKRQGLARPVRFYRCRECSGYHLSSTREGKI